MAFSVERPARRRSSLQGFRTYVSSNSTLAIDDGDSEPTIKAQVNHEGLSLTRALYAVNHGCFDPRAMLILGIKWGTIAVNPHQMSNI